MHETGECLTVGRFDAIKYRDGAQGIAFADLLPAFADAHARGQGLYVPNDTHWNRAGNRLAAVELADIVRPYVDAP